MLYHNQHLQLIIGFYQPYKNAKVFLLMTERETVLSTREDNAFIKTMRYKFMKL